MDNKQPSRNTVFGNIPKKYMIIIVDEKDFFKEGFD